MRNHLRRSALTAVAAVAALGLVAGCGGDSDAEGGQSDGKQSTDTGSAKAPSKSELRQRVLQQGDVEGFTVEKTGRYDMAEPPPSEKTDPAECTPYVDLIVDSAPGDPASVVVRTVTEKQQKPATDGDGNLDKEELADLEDAMKDAMAASAVKVGLAGYGGDAAASALTELRSWTDACQGGFALGEQRQSITDLRSDAPAQGADEAVTFTLNSALEGKPTPWAKFAVYRDGNTVVTFMSTSASTLTGEDAGTGDVPEPVVEAQLAKLG